MRSISWIMNKFRTITIIFNISWHWNFPFIKRLFLICHLFFRNNSAQRNDWGNFPFYYKKNQIVNFIKYRKNEILTTKKVKKWFFKFGFLPDIIVYELTKWFAMKRLLFTYRVPWKVRISNNFSFCLLPLVASFPLISNKHKCSRIFLFTFWFSKIINVRKKFKFFVQPQKFGSYWFSLFDVYWIKTNRQAYK